MTTDPKKREPKIPTRKPDISQSQGRGNPSTRHSREREKLRYPNHPARGRAAQHDAQKQVGRLPRRPTAVLS
jgi:hypothetical protein